MTATETRDAAHRKAPHKNKVHAPLKGRLKKTRPLSKAMGI